MSNLSVSVPPNRMVPAELRPPAVRPEPYGGWTLLACSLPFLLFSIWLLAAPHDAESRGGAGIAVLFTVLLFLGFAWSWRFSLLYRLGREREGLLSAPSDKPLQFSLGELLGGIFVVAVLIGLWGTGRDVEHLSVSSDRFRPMWDLLHGSLAMLSVALLIAGVRKRETAALFVGCPVLLGTLTHFIGDAQFDEVVFLLWSIYALIAGIVLQWRWACWYRQCERTSPAERGT